APTPRGTGETESLTRAAGAVGAAGLGRVAAVGLLAHLGRAAGAAVRAVVAAGAAGVAARAARVAAGAAGEGRGLGGGEGQAARDEQAQDQGEAGEVLHAHDDSLHCLVVCGWFETETARRRRGAERLRGVGCAPALSRARGSGGRGGEVSGGARCGRG